MLDIPVVPPEIKPLATTASVDTIEVFARRLPKGFRRRIESACGRRVEIKPCHQHGVMVIVNRPPLEVLSVLHTLVNDRVFACASRVDVALDFKMQSLKAADALVEWFDHHLVLKWRSSKTRKMIIRTTVYWCDRHKGRNIALYQKRGRVVRLEMRFKRAASVRRAGLDDLQRLPSVNPKLLFDHHCKARRFTERFKLRSMRKAASREMGRALNTKEKRRSRRMQRFLDRYRARIPHRARQVLESIDAQSTGRRGTEDLSLDWLRIPDHVTWPALKRKGNPDGNAMVGVYYGRSLNRT